MRAINPVSRPIQPTRRGFTLVELMVVVAIMAVLAALVAGVVIKATEAQRNSNTLTTMEVIKSSLSKQLQAVIDDGKDKERKGTGTISQTVSAAFPVSLAAATSSNYSKYQNNPNTKINGADPNAYLLRMILEAGPFGKLETDMLPKGAVSPDKPILLDAWGDPISLQISNANNKIKFLLKSPNVSEGISN